MDDLSWSDVLDLIGNARCVFWMCPNKEVLGCRFVEWTTSTDYFTPTYMIATCKDCGTQSNPIYTTEKETT